RINPSAPYPHLHLPREEKTTVRNRAAPDAPSPPAPPISLASLLRRTIPPATWSFPQQFPHSGPVHSRNEFSAAAACPQARPQLVPANQVPRAQSLPPENQERRCRQKA